MRLFRLEIKRILKSRRTLILLAIALLLSVAMAYLPISFEGINRPNKDGTVTELNGLAAIKYKQDLYKTSAGEVTPDRIKSALETYQSCVREYGPVEEEGFPLAVYIEKIVPFRHLLMGLLQRSHDWKICICGCSRRQTWKRRTDNMRPRIGSNRLWKLIKAAVENMGRSRKMAFIWLYILEKSSRSVPY